MVQSIKQNTKEALLETQRGSKALKVVWLPISELKPDQKNPRLHKLKQIRQLARSIEHFGFNVPILIDGDQNIIAGHGRLLGAQQLGWDEVPTISLNHLSGPKKRAFMIADNRLTENSVWDDQLLAEELKVLSSVELNFDIEVTGFDIGEIDFRIESLDEQKNSKEDPADIFPTPADFGPAVSALGDLWILGRHRLVCGNALDADAYELLMGTERAAAVFADPPYNVPIKGHVSGLGAIHHREFKAACGEMTSSEFTAFLKAAFSHAAEYSVPGALHFECMDWRHIAELLTAGHSVFSELKNICVWVKHNAGMGSLYRSQHEFIAVFKNGRVPHRNNIQLGVHGRHRSNVWHYPGATSQQHGAGEGNLLALHPTVKPVALIADAILDTTVRGDIVLDNFLGSGSTLLAAERVGRRCFGIELDPLYVDTIIRRYQAYCGNQARHLSGQTFNEIADSKDPQHD